MNGTTLAFTKKLSGFPMKDPLPGRMGGRGWTRVDHKIESLPPLICPRITRGRKWHLSRKVSKPCGGCQGFTGPEPSTLLDEPARTSCQLTLVYGLIGKSSTICRFSEKILFNSSPWQISFPFRRQRNKPREICICMACSLSPLTDSPNY